MIVQAGPGDAEQGVERRARFLNVVRGRPYFGDLLPAELAVFGAMRGAPVPRFFTATPAAALCIRGRGALLCGTYDVEETGGFLQLHGVEHVQTDGAPPAGYARERQLFCMVYSGAKTAGTGDIAGTGDTAGTDDAAGAAVPFLALPKAPAAAGKPIPQTVLAPQMPCMGSFGETTAFGTAPDAALLPAPPFTGLRIDKKPSPGETADFLMRAKGAMGAQGAEIRDNFYSELCVKLARGAACVWAVRQAGHGNGYGDGCGDSRGGNSGDEQIVASAGAYALTDETAYLAAIETAEPLRGQGIGSWLVGTLAAQLAGEGRRVALVCEEARTAFYRRLGFEIEGTIWRCTREAEA